MQTNYRNHLPLFGSFADKDLNLYFFIFPKNNFFKEIFIFSGQVQIQISWFFDLRKIRKFDERFKDRFYF